MCSTYDNPHFPLASRGAFFRQIVQSLEEQGISCRRYNSRTIFWTFPLFVDLTNTLFEICDAYGSDARDLFRLVILMVALKREAMRGRFLKMIF